MGLLDDIHDEIPRLGGVCSIPAFLETLPESDRNDVLAAFADPVIPSTAIARALARRGFKCSSSTLNRHRRGKCQCGTE